MSKLKPAEREQQFARLFHFLQQQGFDVPIETISKATGIMSRTLYNRYHDKDSLIREILRYWRVNFSEQFNIKRHYCNNAIEELLLFIHDLKQEYRASPFFFQREYRAGCFFQPGTDRFMDMITCLLRENKNKDIFLPSLNEDDYALFFLFNIVNGIVRENLTENTCIFVLRAALSNEGCLNLQTLLPVSFVRG
ncbi:MAG: TetR/AcrR family transcriptional regulator [Bacteroidales bacterium]|jgi:AcrR family transcriptional regulator|nr:TetR/AcrR family transcriptional regulator [Bacteroidales bacterium]